MPTQRSDDAPKRRRAIAVVEIGVLFALGASVVLAVIVGQSAGDGADVAPEVAPVPEPQESDDAGVANATPTSTSSVPDTTQVAPPTESTSNDAAPTPASGELTTSAAEALPVDDDLAADLTPTTEPRAPSLESEETWPEPEVSSLEPDITALLEGPFVEIDIGPELACGLLSDGRVKCWGKDSAADSAPTEQRFSLVEAGLDTACGIDMSGQLVCWGLDDFLDFDDPSGPHMTVALSARRLCALRMDGALVCSEGETNPDIRGIGTHRFTAIAAGYGAICAVDADGTASCWGDIRESNSSALRSAKPPRGPFVEIYVDAGGKVACAIRTDRTAACWGDTKRPRQ